MDVNVPISPGEWFDKISILLLKVHRGRDDEKRVRALKHLYVLMNQQDLRRVDWTACQDVICDLYDTNAELWKLEEAVRDPNLTDSEMLSNCEQIRIHNALRAAWKRDIDETMESRLIEVKDYGDE